MVLNPRTPFAIICSELLFCHFGFLATFFICLSDFSISDNFLYLASSEMPCQLCINSNTFGDWFSSSSYSHIYLTNHFWCRYLYQFSDLWKWQPILYSYPLNLFFQFPLWALSRVCTVVTFAVDANKEGRKEGHFLFNDALNTFYLLLYGVIHMVKNHSDSERRNPLPPNGLLFPISRQDNTYHGLCYTSRGALARTRNTSLDPP